MPRDRRRLIKPSKPLKLKPTMSLVRRMMAKVEENKTRKKYRGTYCRSWQGRCDDNGYGQIKVQNQAMGAHRVFFVIFRRSLRAGETVDHLCHHNACCNPAHLRPLTHKDNSREGLARQHGVEDLIPFEDQF